MADSKHTVIKTFRFTESETALLKRKAAEIGISESSYIRLMLNNRPMDYQDIRELVSRLINEVNHIGNNINQIAKRCNMGMYSRYESEKLKAYMRKLINAVREVEEKIGSN